MGIGEHVTAGAVAGYVVAYGLNYAGLEVNTGLMVAGAIAGAMLCDIDIEESFLGRKVPFISGLINSWFGHRTLTHSLLFLLILSLLGSYISLEIGIGLGLGVLSHIILDMFTGRGVAYLYPFLKKRIKWFTILD